jgi:tRNA G37 N-methylase TrmD
MRIAIGDYILDGGETDRAQQTAERGPTMRSDHS